MSNETIFSKIIRKEIPAAIVFESDSVLAFRDIQPQAPVHILIIPKTPYASLLEMPPTLVGEISEAAKSLAHSEGIADNGFRIVANTGDNGGQTVNHFHLHLLGGRKLNAPLG